MRFNVFILLKIKIHTDSIVILLVINIMNSAIAEYINNITSFSSGGVATLHCTLKQNVQLLNIIQQIS